MCCKMMRKLLSTQKMRLSFCIQPTYYHHTVDNLVKEFESYKMSNNIQEPSLNLCFLLNKDNRNVIEENMKFRKTHVDLNELYELFEKFQLSKDKSVRKELLVKALLFPNTTHPDVSKTEDFEIVKTTNDKKKFDFKPKSFLSLTSKNGYCRTDQISHYLGSRSYYFTSDLCLLENAIIQYVLDKLIKLKFQLITVPDILPEDVIRRCGMNTRAIVFDSLNAPVPHETLMLSNGQRGVDSTWMGDHSGERSQIYHLEPDFYGAGWCLSGTAEMGIAWHLMNQNVPGSQLPMRIAAMSKCYRAEISDVGDEKGVYRVHCFTKIEMFGVTHPEESESELNEFLRIEETLFGELGLHTRTLHMGACELGAQAHRKYDVEAWMPGRNRWGELSSCSDCTDYQARRLNIRSEDGNFVHTLNGTACAVPRLLMALVETHQNKDGTVSIPLCLRPYMFNKEVIGATRGAPALVKVKLGLSKAKKKELAKVALKEKVPVSS